MHMECGGERWAVPQQGQNHAPMVHKPSTRSQRSGRHGKQKISGREYIRTVHRERRPRIRRGCDAAIGAIRAHTACHFPSPTATQPSCHTPHTPPPTPQAAPAPTANPSPPPKKHTFGSVSSSGCTPRTPTAAAMTRLAATRPPTPADAADAPNTNMRALRKGASVSSRRRVACE